MTIGTWRVLYEAVVDRKRHCMCQCVECGVRKIIMAFKLRQRYALRCRECKIKQDLVAV